MKRKRNPLREIPGILVVRSRARVEVHYDVDRELLTMQLHASPRVERFYMRINRRVSLEIRR